MSNAVKILLVVNLLLAIVVAVVTMMEYATGENWKRRWDSDTKQLQAHVTDSDNQVTKLSYEVAQAQAQKLVAEATIGTLIATNKQIDADRTEKAADISRLTQEVTQKSQEIVSLRDVTQSLNSSLENARQNANEKTHIAQVARSAAFQLNVKLAENEDDLNNTKTKLTQTEEEFVRLTKDNNQQKALLAILKERHPRIWSEIADEKQSAAFLQGIVAAVKTDAQGKQDLVVLTVGRSSAAIEEGTEFIIFRGGKYIVRARVEKVLSDMISCRVIPESWNKEGLDIKQGDTAQNRL